MATGWQVFMQDGCYFLDHFHDITAIKDRHIDQVWDIRDDDVIVCTFPKSGTLWTLNALSRMYGDLNMLLPGTDRAVRLGYICEGTDKFAPGVYGDHVKNVKENLKKMNSPRLLACHLPPQHFHTSWKEGNRNCKVIYVTRNPKDVCVSLFYFLKSIKFIKMEHTWDEWVRAFVEGKVMFGPWLEHISSWQQFGREDNVLHLKYEDMKRDLKSSLLKVAEFLGRPVTEEHVDHVVQVCSVAAMRQSGDGTRIMAVSDGANFKEGYQYIRKGQIGNWKQHFTVAQSEWFDQRLSAEIQSKGLDIHVS